MGDLNFEILCNNFNAKHNKNKMVGFEYLYSTKFSISSMKVDMNKNLIKLMQIWTFMYHKCIIDDIRTISELNWMTSDKKSNSAEY